MTVVCAGQQVNRIDLGSVDVGLVAALLLVRIEGSWSKWPSTDLAFHDQATSRYILPM